MQPLTPPPNAGDFSLFLARTNEQQPAPSTRASALPQDVENELFSHAVWLCENGYPPNWDGIKAVAWQLGKVAGLDGEWGRGAGEAQRGVLLCGSTLSAVGQGRVTHTLAGKLMHASYADVFFSSSFGLPLDVVGGWEASSAQHTPGPSTALYQEFFASSRRDERLSDGSLCDQFEDVLKLSFGMLCLPQIYTRWCRCGSSSALPQGYRSAIPQNFRLQIAPAGASNFVYELILEAG